MLADAGGSNGCHIRAWKERLQVQICDRFGLTVTVCHYPTGCSNQQVAVSPPFSTRLHHMARLSICRRSTSGDCHSAHITWRSRHAPHGSHQRSGSDGAHIVGKGRAEAHPKSTGSSPPATLLLDAESHPKRTLRAEVAQAPQCSHQRSEGGAAPHFPEGSTPSRPKPRGKGRRVKPSSYGVVPVLATGVDHTFYMAPRTSGSEARHRTFSLSPRRSAGSSSLLRRICFT